MVSIPCIILLYLNRKSVSPVSSKISIFGFLIIGWPQMAVFIIKFSEITLIEFNFVAFRFLPAMIFGMLIYLLDRPKILRPELFFYLTTPIIAVIYGFLDNQTYLYPVAWILLAFPFLFVSSKEIDRSTVGSIYSLSVRGIVALALIIAFIQPEKSFTSCRADKCTSLGFVFAPEGSQSNVISLTLGLLVALIDFKKKYSWILTNSICLILIAEFAGGRSGTIAGLACLISVLIFKFTKGRTSKTYKLFLSSLCFFSLIPVFFTFNTSSFTGRSSLWIIAKQFISESILFGYGASFWIRLPATNEIQANYSPHNIWLEILVSTGLVGLISLFIAIAISVVKCDPNIRPFALSLLSGFFVAGFSESIVIPYRLVITPGFFLVFICLTSRRNAKKGTDKLYE